MNARDARRLAEELEVRGCCVLQVEKVKCKGDYCRIYMTLPVVSSTLSVTLGMEASNWPRELLVDTADIVLAEACIHASMKHLPASEQVWVEARPPMVIRSVRLDPKDWTWHRTETRLPGAPKEHEQQ